MKPKIAISCDDGLIDQFKWARLFGSCNIPCTFYVNPFTINCPGLLSLDNLKQMELEWGHIIANHLWIHEAPAHFEEWIVQRKQVILGNFYAAKDWLCKNGFVFGASMLALPYGTLGGKWTPEYVDELVKETIQIRDFGVSVLNKFHCVARVTATEQGKVEIKEDHLSCYCFHGNKTCSDEAMSLFVEDVCNARDRGDVEVVSLLKVANAQ
jgi:hypothetical protein